MIRIKRSEECPGTLNSEKVKKAKKELKAIADKRKPLSTEFKNYWGEKDVRAAIWEMQFRKCCYCERKRDQNRESDIEHFRPKAAIEEASDHKGYWWLAYDWDNLFFSCRYCNQAFKKNYFPLLDEAKRAHSPADSLDEEEPLLIDPCKEDPIEHLSFDWFEESGIEALVVFASTRRNSKKGRKTIEIASLNREELVIARSRLLEDLEAMATILTAVKEKPDHNKTLIKYKKKVLKVTASDQEFCAFTRDFFIKNHLGEFISRD